MLLCVMTKHLHFGLNCPKDIVPEVLGFVQMQLCKLKQYYHVLVKEKKLLPENCPKKSYLLSIFLIVLSLTLPFNKITEASRV